MSDSENTGFAGSEANRAGPLGLARAFIRLWAIAGGLLVIAIVLMTASSVVSGFVFGKPFPGDFELVELGIAIAAFAFLPYCQLTGSNVTVDIFTAWASQRLIEGFRLVSGILAAGFSALLLVQMSDGMQYYREYGETTYILELPIWWAFPPILFSLGLLFVASMITILEAWNGVRRPSYQSL